MSDTRPTPSRERGQDSAQGSTRLSGQESTQQSGADASQDSDRVAGQGRTHGGSAGTTEGTATHLTDVIGRVEPFETKPRASVVHSDDTCKIVSFEFGEGQELPDHAAFHPVLIQILRGRVELGLPDRTIVLAPDEFLHLTPKLRHNVVALETTTLTVTMLLPRD